MTTATTMNALDLCCSAGGAALGYNAAGFDVTGIDIARQPRFPFAFIQADVLSLSLDFLRQFDLLHASPPCQAHSAMWVLHNAKPHVDLIGPIRDRLIAAGVPYVIENVPGAPLRNPIVLCGSMFDLRAPDGANLKRHRLFETSFPLTAPSRCQHRKPVIGVYGGHNRDRQREAGTNHRSGSNRPWAHAFIAMGVPIGSMTLNELSQAIPPAYSRYVAEAFLQAAKAGAAATELEAAP